MAASRLYTAFYRVRTKREQSNPSKWKEAVRKKRRLQGAEHVNTSGKLKDKLKMGPECTSSACKKSKLRDCDSISTDDRQKMFNTFWRLSSWESRKVYVTTTVKSVDIKQKKNSCTKFTKKCLFCIHSDSSRWYKQTSVLYFRHKPHCRVVARSSPNNVEEEPNQERLSKAPKSGIRSKASEGSPQLSTITIWSDGFEYQNRCTAVANMYYHLSLEMNVKVFQKYLVSGHTQMECDSIHSTSERYTSKIDVYTPHEYALLMKTACRKSP
ncbi:hypothetical protein RRG08_030336 [Elysia crispata]|uniref:Uncharacterized protein n=1 Tax=Elysia crispata TaxID=231223 RepID=A0AAE0YJ88_9GAST|nr:hypothetical protein RRG08_030336 [Elysia crispata]